MKKYKRIFYPTLVLIMLIVIIFPPSSIVSKSPFLFSFITIFIISFSIIAFVITFKKDGVLPKKTNIVMIIIVVILSLGFIPSLIFNGMNFENSKIRHLQKNGHFTKALITDKKSSKFVRRGREISGHSLSLSYICNQKDTINVTLLVTEIQYNRTKIGDSCLVIFSLKDNQIVQPLITNEDKSNFNKDILDSKYKDDAGIKINKKIKPQNRAINISDLIKMSSLDQDSIGNILKGICSGWEIVGGNKGWMNEKKEITILIPNKNHLIFTTSRSAGYDFSKQLEELGFIPEDSNNSDMKKFKSENFDIYIRKVIGSWGAVTLTVSVKKNN